MIRILHSVSYMDRGGIETMLMNYYRHIDRDKVQFDFLCNKVQSGAYDEEIISLGGRIFRTPGLNPIKYSSYLRYMKCLFDNHPEYRIIHVHNGALGVYALHAAKINDIPIRVFHAHNTRIAFDLKWPIKMLCMLFLSNECNIHWTCGKEAARRFFGSKVVENSDFTYIPNAIEPERFIYSEVVRQQIRRKYGLDDKTVIGHIGRFWRQKNHVFVIDVFEIIHRMCPNAILVLLGDGSLRPKIEKLVERKGLKNCVYIMGAVDNPHEWYQGFDAFLLPSLWEGLPLVGIEAQTASLPCLFSGNISREAAVSGHVSFLSLDTDRAIWAKTLLNLIHESKRIDMSKRISDVGYDIRTAAIKLQSQYENLLTDIIS